MIEPLCPACERPTGRRTLVSAATPVATHATVTENGQVNERPDWYRRFIARERERGRVQLHLLAMLEVLLSETERELGRRLPPPELLRVNGIGCVVIGWSNDRETLRLYINTTGEIRYGSLKWLRSPTQLAEALHKLLAGKEDDKSPHENTLRDKTGAAHQ